MKRAIIAVGIFLGLLFAGKAQATLTVSGTDLVYDSTTNLYWNLNAALSGAHRWQGDVDWANNLVLGGFSDFHLATLSELKGLYNDLKASGGCNGYDCTGSVSPFSNIQSDYWSGTEFDASNAWEFGFNGGGSGRGSKVAVGFDGLAVRSGDSVGVPEPASLTLLGFGLLALYLRRRRQT